MTVCDKEYFDDIFRGISTLSTEEYGKIVSGLIIIHDEVDENFVRKECSLHRIHMELSDNCPSARGIYLGVKLRVNG